MSVEFWVMSLIFVVVLVLVRHRVMRADQGCHVGVFENYTIPQYFETVGARDFQHRLCVALTLGAICDSNQWADQDCDDRHERLERQRYSSAQRSECRFELVHDVHLA